MVVLGDKGCGWLPVKAQVQSRPLLNGRKRDGENRISDKNYKCTVFPEKVELIRMDAFNSIDIVESFLKDLWSKVKTR